MSRSSRSVAFSRRVRFLAGLLAVGFFLFVGAHAFAQTGSALQSASLQQFGATTKLPSTPLPVIIAQIIRAVIGVMGIVLTILIVYAGFQYMTAGGDEQKTIRAKNIIKNAGIGLLIMISAFTITQFILSSLQTSLGLGTTKGSSAVSRYQEPLASALGKVIQDQYPERDALDIPRNTKIMVTFVDPIKPEDIISGYATNPAATDLNFAQVKIFKTADTETAALAANKVKVSVSADKRTFVFKPVDLLGSDLKDTNYTVTFKSGIRNATGKVVLGTPGYSWTFQVSTKVDLTPPHVQSVVPVEASEQNRNVTVELTFNEAMDPTTASGVFNAGDPTKNFTDITVTSQVLGSANIPKVPVNGTFVVSNGYRTVDFTTDVECAKDACGNVVYCLPSQQNIRVVAHAATVDTTSPPQALVINGGLDGLSDAAGNSLDAGQNAGAGDGKADGPGTDDYVWAFTTNNGIDNRTPALASVTPSILQPMLGPDTPVTFAFNMPMKASSLVSANIQLWPDPYYAMWFLPRSADVDKDGKPVSGTQAVDHSQANIQHPPLIASADGGHDYYPVVTNDVRGNNQFCFFPAVGPASGSSTGACNVSPSRPYCCNGQSSVTACPAPKSKTELPDTSS